MSAGPRLPIGIAQEAARWLSGLWGLDQHAGLVVGSVRRGALDVGDLEFACRAPAPGKPDTLYDAIAETLETEGLFGASTVPVARTVAGVKRGFWAASMTVAMTHEASGQVIEALPVQIFRWAADDRNRGWVTLRCTGPGEFGKWFLARWKRVYGIHPDAKASVDGHLVDRHGVIVPVLSEQECFEKCGMGWIDPSNRGKVVARTSQEDRR